MKTGYLWPYVPLVLILCHCSNSHIDRYVNGAVYLFTGDIFNCFQVPDWRVLLALCIPDTLLFKFAKLSKSEFVLNYSITFFQLISMCSQIDRCSRILLDQNSIKKLLQETYRRMSVADVKRPYSILPTNQPTTNPFWEVVSEMVKTFNPAMKVI